MARCVFYSFHYKADCHSASQIRNMGVWTVTNPQPTMTGKPSIKMGGQAIED
jgi:hypothetical protein